MAVLKKHLYTLNSYNFQRIDSLAVVDTDIGGEVGGVDTAVNCSPSSNPNQDITELGERQFKEFERKQLVRFLKDKRTHLHRQVEKGLIYFRYAEQSSYTLDDFDTEFLFDRAVLNLRGRVNFDEEGHFKHAVCNNCKEVVKKRALALHSFCRYSSVVGNVRAMISKNKKKLKTLLRNLPRIKEFVISFPTHPAYFLCLKPGYEKVINLFFKALRKAGVDFPTLQAIDFKKEGGLWQIHFHFIAPNLEQKYFDVRVWHKVRRQIIEKTGQDFTVSLGRYKSKRRVIGYFALAMSGRYTANGKHHGVGLDEMVDEREYLVNFFGMRSFSIRGHRGQTLINFDAEYFAELCTIQCLSIPKVCPFCGNSDIILITEDRFLTLEPPPPPNQLNYWQEKAILLEATNPALAQAYKERGTAEFEEKLIKEIMLEDTN